MHALFVTADSVIPDMNNVLSPPALKPPFPPPPPPPSPPPDGLSDNHHMHVLHLTHQVQQGTSICIDRLTHDAVEQTCCHCSFTVVC